MERTFQHIALEVPPARFENWEHFVREAPEYSIGLEVMDDTPGHRGHHVHFDHHEGVIREATMSAAMQAYIAVRQGRLMEKWLQRRRPVPVYVWNADQDVCLAAFVLEYHELLERAEVKPLLRWIVQYNNKIDVCGGIYPVNLTELVDNHFTWVFEGAVHNPILHRQKQDGVDRFKGDPFLFELILELLLGLVIEQALVQDPFKLLEDGIRRRDTIIPGWTTTPTTRPLQGLECDWVEGLVALGPPKKTPALW